MIRFSTAIISRAQARLEEAEIPGNRIREGQDIPLHQFLVEQRVQDFHYEVEVSLRPIHERALPEPLWPKD